MEPFLAAVAGLALGLLIARSRADATRRSRLLGRPQLLRWLEESPGGWLIVDGSDTVQLINSRAERLLDVPGAGLRHTPPLAEVCGAPPLIELIRDARLRRRTQRLEWHAAGEELDLFALPGEDGWVAVVLRSRRSLEAQLEQQERWVSDVAHELKTPLTALLLVGDSLAAQVNSRNAVLVERLQRELLRLQELVGDLLELSRLENTLPREGLRRSEVDLLDLVEQVWGGLRPLAEQRGIRLDLRPPPQGQAPSRLLGDPSRLHRAVLNLLDNAVRYSPDQACVHVRLQASVAWCLLSVRDEGPGLSEEDQEHLFERFYRGDPSRVRSRRGGSGLGLAIVQQIALAHGGRVQASNHPAGGARLELLLPAGR